MDMAGEVEATQAGTAAAAPPSRSSSGSKMVTLRSSDGELFEVCAEAFAGASGTIKKMMLDSGHAGPVEVVHLPGVTSPILSCVDNYCNHHYGAGASPSVFASFSSVGVPLRCFDLDFIRDADQDTLFDLMLTADHLAVEGLLDLTCRKVADRIRGSPEEICERFHVVNDYTEEEEEDIRKEISWAFKDKATVPRKTRDKQRHR